MKIDMKRALNDLDGNPIVEREGGPAYSVGAVIRTVLLQPAPRENAYTPEESVARYDLAMLIHAALQPEAADSTVNLSVDRATSLRKEISAAFAPIVSGQMAKVLNGEA